MVVITDGIDTSSGLTPSEVSGIASAIDVPVYVIATVLPIDHPGRESALVDGGAPERGRRRSRISRRWTGGAFFYASTPADTSNAARQVLDELRQQYVIAFEPATGEWLAAARDSDSGQGLHRARAERLHGRTGAATAG